MAFGPAHTPGKTFFNGIFEILPGHFGKLKKGRFTTTKYWDLKTRSINDDLNSCISKVKNMVGSSLNNHLLLDKNLSTMLSGGLDSSILTYLTSKKINPLATFAIDFKDNQDNFLYNEYQPTRDSEYVLIMQNFLNTAHTTITFNNLDLYNSLRNVVIARDAPGMGDIDSSMYLFCNKIKEFGYNIALSGECSDEIFGGYPWYYNENLINYEYFPWSCALKTRFNLVNKELISKDYFQNYINNNYNASIQDLEYPSSDTYEIFFKKTCYLTTKWFMNTLLERIDRISEACDLKIRIPFADYKIFEYIYNVPAKFKMGLINDNTQPIEKYLLKKAFEEELPKEIIYRKKSPFPKTYDPLYAQILENEIAKIINSSTDPLLEIIDVKYLFKILHSKGSVLKENWFGQLMQYPQLLAYLIQINIWLKEYNIKIEL